MLVLAVPILILHSVHSVPTQLPSASSASPGSTQPPLLAAQDAPGGIASRPFPPPAELKKA